ncbi:MAG TPA: AMP-binding protein [Jatrophihabitans sp.]|jgi:fatty-acyl-CoA synthase
MSTAIFGSVPVATTLPELLAQAADAVPDHEALVAGATRWTYSQLADEVAHAAAALDDIGVGVGSSVALLAPNIAQWVPIALGAQLVGARVDAFNTWVRAYDLDYLLRTSGADVLVTVDTVRSANLIGEITTLLPELEHNAPGEWRSAAYPSLRHIAVLGQQAPRGADRWDDLRKRASGAVETQRAALRSAPVIDGESVAFVLYTSGSTKNPKAVPLEQRKLIENGFHIGERMGLGADDRIWFGSPLFWSFGCANALMATFTHRACFVLQEQFEARAAVALMAEERVTAAYLLPAMAEALAAAAPDEMRALDSLRTGATIGRPDEVERVALDLGVGEICNVYGATENYGNCCVTDRRDPLEVRLYTQGRPLPGVEARVVDPETGELLGRGVPGELHIRGRVTRGYLNDDEANAEAFAPDGWYRTGDRMIINDDGSVTYIGRLNDMIKTSGINVSPAEVEGFLTTHPDVAEVVVMGAPHPTRDQVVVAFVVPKTPELTAESVTDYCRANIAGYKVPWVVSIVSSIPTTGTGKIARRNLLDTAAELVVKEIDRREGVKQ